MFHRMDDHVVSGLSSLGQVNSQHDDSKSSSDSSNSGKQFQPISSLRSNYGTCPFMLLPVEIRQVVYRYVVRPEYPNRHVRRRLGKAETSPRACQLAILGLMWSCRFLYADIQDQLPELLTLNLVSIEALDEGLWMFSDHRHPKGYRCIGTNLDPVIRNVQYVTSQWQAGDWRPVTTDIPLVVVTRNMYNWKKLTMLADTFMRPPHQASALVKGLRLRWALQIFESSHERLNNFIRMGSRYGLEISVVVKIEDRSIGRLGCVAHLKGGSVAITQRDDSMPKVDELQRIFCEVLRLRMHPSEDDT